NRTAFTLDNSNGIIEIQSNQLLENNFAIIPNPNNGEFKIILRETSSYVSIVNPLGVTVYENKQISTNEINVNLKDIAKGMYLVKVNAEGKVFTKKVVVN